MWNADKRGERCTEQTDSKESPDLSPTPQTPLPPFSSCFLGARKRSSQTADSCVECEGRGKGGKGRGKGEEGRGERERRGGERLEQNPNVAPED